MKRMTRVPFGDPTANSEGENRAKKRLSGTSNSSKVPGVESAVSCQWLC